MPTAPGYIGWWVGLGGVMGTAYGASFAPWRALAAASWGLSSGPDTVFAALQACAWPPIIGGLMGVTVALVMGYVSLGAWAPALRWRPTVQASARVPGVFVLLGAVLAGWMVPGVLARTTGGRPGWSMVAAPLVALALAGLFTLPIAVWLRARARHAHQLRVDPEDAPRRDDEGLRGALKRAFRSRS